MLGAGLNALNTRLDPQMVAFMLDHGEAKVVIVDTEFAPIMSRALALRTSKAPIQVIDVADPLYTGNNQPIGTQDYEAFLGQGDPEFDWDLTANEGHAITLTYTSVTTGNPTRVVYHPIAEPAAAVPNNLKWTTP